jgi:hypothetical protein
MNSGEIEKEDVLQQRQITLPKKISLISANLAFLAYNKYITEDFS